MRRVARSHSVRSPYHSSRYRHSYNSFLPASLPLKRSIPLRGWGREAGPKLLRYVEAHLPYATSYNRARALSTNPALTPPRPHIAGSVNEHFNIPIASFKAIRSLRERDRLMATALVFETDKVLLLQRSPGGFAPNFWEPPGGTSEDADGTLLDTVVRELEEETGLRTRSVIKAVGTESGNANDGIVFRDSQTDVIWSRFLFDVEVESFKEVHILPKEHQRYIWATEDEVRLGWAAEMELKFIASSLRAAILEGFRQRHQANY